jgi:hypothetical protein
MSFFLFHEYTFYLQKGDLRNRFVSMALHSFMNESVRSEEVGNFYISLPSIMKSDGDFSLVFLLGKIGQINFNQVEQKKFRNDVSGE